jgi:hypothetical protein
MHRTLNDIDSIIEESSFCTDEDADFVNFDDLPMMK